MMSFIRSLVRVMMLIRTVEVQSYDVDSLGRGIKL